MASTVIYTYQKKENNHMKTQMEKDLFGIIFKNFGRSDLETRNSDNEDFLDVSVWTLKAALEEAYKAGQDSKK